MRFFFHSQGGFELCVVPAVREEFESRYLQLHKRLTSIRAESEEVWKTLETAESSLMEMISAKDYDVTPLFAASGGDDDKFPPPAPPPKLPEAALLKMRSDRQETEDFYLSVSTCHLPIILVRPSPLNYVISLLTHFFFLLFNF